MDDYGNNALHFPEPDGSLEPTLTPELIEQGYSTLEPNGHLLIVTFRGSKIATFGAGALREYIRGACFEHLQRVQ